MRQNVLTLLTPLIGMLVMAGCASVNPAQDPAQPSAMLVDSLYFTNAMNDQPDVQRTVRALAPAVRDVAYFPMAQVKQCDKDGAAAAGACSTPSVRWRRRACKPTAWRSRSR